MSTWVGMAPVIGNSSLDGFAIGALMSGACALAITAPRRTQARQAPMARDGRGRAAERSGWRCEHVIAAEAVWAGKAAGAVQAGMGAHAAGARVAAAARADPAGRGLRARRPARTAG